MLSYAQSSFLIVTALVISTVLVAVLNRVWPISHRKLVNDVTGWQLGILGTTYGVILGFMLYTVWNDFHVAEINTHLEAASLLTVSRISAGLPSPEREAFHARLRSTASAFVDSATARAMAKPVSSCAQSQDPPWSAATVVTAKSPC